MTVQLFLLCSVFPIIILFLPAHSQLLLSSFVLVFVLCVSSFFVLFPLNSDWGLFVPCPTFPHFPVVICCPSVGSSNAVSGANTMRRSTTAPIWGSNPRRRRSRHQNYKTKIFNSGLFSPPPLPPSGKNPHPKIALFLNPMWCGW